MSLWVYICKEEHVCEECDGVGHNRKFGGGRFDLTCPHCEGTGEYGDTKIERLERGKRRRPNPKCHLCGKKMELVK